MDHRERPFSYWNDPTTRLIEIASRNVVHLAPSDTLINAARHITRHNISSLLVLSPGRKPLGIVTEHDLLRAMYRGLPAETLLTEIMTAPVITVPLSINCHEAYQLCLDRGIRHLVIVDPEGRVSAIVSETDFRRHLELAPLTGPSTVAAAINRVVDTLPPEADLRTALSLMAGKSGSCIVVTNGTLPVGILTERDVARLCSRKEQRLEDCLADIMSAPVRTIRVETPLTAAVERMLASRIRQLPAVDKTGQLLGILDARTMTRVLAIKMIDSTLTLEKRRSFSLLEEAPFPVVISRLRDGIIRYCNPFLAKHFGIGRKALLDIPITRFYLNPEDRETLETLIRDRGCIADQEVQLVDGKGHPIHAIISSAIIDFENEPALLSAINDITQRKQVEEALRQERTKFQTVFHSIPDMVWLKDPEGTYLACNRTFEKFFGASQTAILGKSDYDFVDRDLADFFRTNDRLAVAAGGPVSNEEWLRFAEGGYEGLFEAVKTPITDENGALIGVLGIARDITERRRTERDLRERIKEQQCLHAISALTEDIDQPLSDQLRQVVEQVGPGWQYPEITAVRLEYADLSLTTEGFRETPWMQIAEMANKQGERIRLSVAYLEEPPRENEGPFSREKGHLADAIVHRLADTTDRRYSATLVRERDRIIATMFDQTTDAIILMDPQSRQFIDFNDVAHRGLGYTREEFSRLTVENIEADYSSKQIRANVSDATGGRALQFETRLRHKNNTVRDVALTIQSITLNEKQRLSVVWRDITEQKRGEQAIKERAERLRLQNWLLGQFATSPSALDGDLHEVSREITALIGDTLAIGRVSVWLTDSTEGVPVCLEHYETATSNHSRQHCLDGAALRSLIGPLTDSRSLEISDVRADARSRDWFENTLAPLDIASFLYCSMVSSGRQRGVLCLEHVHRTHQWEPDEIAFGCQVADHLGMVLLNRERMAAQEALAQSETLLKQAQEVAKTGYWHFTFASKTLSWSDETYRIFELPLGSPIAMETYGQRIHPDDFAAVRASWKAALSSGTFQAVHRILVGERIKWVEQRAAIEFDDAGQLTMALGIIQDITANKENEDRLHQLNRTYAMLTSISEAIVRIRDSDRLFAEVCRILVERGEFDLAWIGNVADNGEIVLAAQASGPDARTGQLFPSISERALAGEAITTGQARVINDLGGQPAALMPEFDHADLLKRGHRALGVFPILVGDEPQSIIGVYAGQANLFSPELIELFNRLTSNIGLALEVTRATANALEEQNFRQTLIDSVAGLFYAIDTNGHLILWNRQVESVTNCSREELATMHVLDHFREEDKNLAAQAISEAFLTGESSQEITLLPGDGQLTPFLFNNRRIVVKDQPLIVGSAVDISAQVKAVRQLRESEKRLQGITDSALDAILMMDHSGAISYWNPAAERILGYSAAEALGQNLHQLIIPEHCKPDYLATYKKFQQTGHGDAAGTTLELAAFNKDGRELTVALSMSAVFLDSNWHTVGILRDISELKRSQAELQSALAATEQANREKNAVLAHLEELVALRTRELDAANEQLRISEERYTMAMDATTDGLWDWNVPEGQTYVSPAYWRMLGYAPNERPADLQNSWIDLLHPDDRGRVVATVRQRLEQVGNFEIEFRMRTKSGSSVWILSRGKVVERDADNRPVRVIGVHTDVTTRKQIELELRIANEEQHAIFEAAATGIAFIKNRQILRCNRQLEDLFGYDAEEFIGRLTRCWYASEAEFQTMGEEVARQLQQTGKHSAVRRLIRKDGSRFWARMTAQAIDPEDLSKGLVGMVEDITQERAASEALHRAKEEAEAATRAKSKFLANMSHEIRTPMNAIMGFAHLLRRDALTPQQSDQLDKLTDASRHLLRVINNILDISKIEANKMALDIEDFEPARVLDQVCGIVADPIAAKRLGFHVNLDHIPLVLRGDGARLGQVFLNLIGNALKFTEQGRIDIVGSLLSENDEQVVVRFEVRDTGIGMTGDQLQRVFVAFEQADSSTTRRFGGTGLGLAISKRLVELMGGTIGVESSPGRGTRFWFELPFARAAHPPVMRLPREVLGRMHALVIDEDRDSREILANMLIELGMRVNTADSGEHGLEAVVRADRSGDSHTLLVIDARLPGIDGIETVARLQALDLSIRPLFVIITAYGGQLMQETVETAGIHRVMPKPVTPSILHDTLVELIQPSMEYRRPNSAAEEELSKRRGSHILLVEDNPINQEVAKALLEAMGMRVSVADNGQTAVDMIGTTSFDLVFMDIQMPVMDGLRATRAIRQRPEGHSLPILAMTANAFREDREQCLQAGMNDHIAKPIEQGMLQNLLIRWLPATNRNGALSGETPSGPQPPQRDGQALLSRLHAIDGLDAKAGQKRLGGDHALYLHILQRFIDDHGQTGEVLAALARRGDTKALREKAHGLKGVVGTLGAVRLQRETAELEALCRSGADNTAITRKADRIRHLLESFTASLRTTLPPPSPLQAEGPPAGMEQNQRNEALAVLEELLQRGDTAATDLFEQVKSELYQTFGTIAEQLDREIRSFEYQNAAGTVRHMRSKQEAAES